MVRRYPLLLIIIEKEYSKLRMAFLKLRLWGDGSPRSGNSTSQEVDNNLHAHSIILYILICFIMTSLEVENNLHDHSIILYILICFIMTSPEVNNNLHDYCTVNLFIVDKVHCSQSISSTSSS